MLGHISELISGRGEWRMGSGNKRVGWRNIKPTYRYRTFLNKYSFMTLRNKGHALFEIIVKCQEMYTMGLAHTARPKRCLSDSESNSKFIAIVCYPLYHFLSCVAY